MTDITCKGEKAKTAQVTNTITIEKVTVTMVTEAQENNLDFTTLTS